MSDRVRDRLRANDAHLEEVFGLIVARVVGIVKIVTGTEVEEVQEGTVGCRSW